MTCKGHHTHAAISERNKQTSSIENQDISHVSCNKAVTIYITTKYMTEILDKTRMGMTIAFCHLRQVVQKPVNANPGLKVNRRVDFSCIKMFFTAYGLCILRLFTVRLTPKYFFRLNKSLHLFKTHCTILNKTLTFNTL